MSCRASAVPPHREAESRALELGEACVDFARADRWDDFRWLLEAQGLALGDIETLWRRLRAATRRRPAPPGAEPVSRDGGP